MAVSTIYQFIAHLDFIGAITVESVKTFVNIITIKTIAIFIGIKNQVTILIASGMIGISAVFIPQVIGKKCGEKNLQF